MPTDQFGGRDMVSVGDTFGEAFVYYRSYHPGTGTYQQKVGLLKRVVAQGVPLLVGAGYYVSPDRVVPGATCSNHYVEASAIQTRAEIQAFVQCAAEYAMAHGTDEARRAFNEDERWKYGPTYVFVDGIEQSGEDAFTYVFPPDPTREGMVWGSSIDGFGTDYYFELHRILSIVDSGWIHYAFSNPATGLRQAKSSYVIEMDWNGDRVAIGAGFYARDFPGACDPGEVNAADLESDPTDQKLREFVRCAAMMVESSGYFAGPVLSGDPRWKHGSVYVFGITLETGKVEFSGSPSSFAISRRIPELFDGRDMVDAGGTFGEVFWYYNFTNPATGAVQTKVAFVKRVLAQGIPIIVGSGYNPPPLAPAN